MQQNVTNQLGQNVQQNANEEVASNKDQQNNSNVNSKGRKFSTEKGSLSKMILKYANFLIVLGLLLGASLMGYLAYEEYNKIDRLDSTKVELDKELTKLNSYANYLKRLASLKDRLTRNLELSKQAIPIDQEISQLLNQLLTISSESKMNVVEQIYAGETQDSTSLREAGTINLQIRSIGTFFEIEDFLERFENSRRLTSLNSFVLKSDPEAESKQDGRYTPPADELERFEPNINLQGKDYVLDMTVTSYYLGEIDVEQINYDELLQRGTLDDVVNEIEEKIWYEIVEDVDFTDIGTDNPFIPGDSIDINNDNNAGVSTTTNSPSDDDTSGFQ